MINFFVCRFIYEFNFTHNFVYPLDATKPMLRHQYGNIELEVKASLCTGLITIIDPFEPDKNISRHMRYFIWCHFMKISRQIITQKEDYFENLQNFHKFLMKKKQSVYKKLLRPCHCFIVKSAKKCKATGEANLIKHLMKDFSKFLIEDGLIKSIKNELSKSPVNIKDLKYYENIEITEYNGDMPKLFKLATIIVELNLNLLPVKQMRKKCKRGNLKFIQKDETNNEKNEPKKDESKKEDNENEINIQDVPIDLFGLFHSRYFFVCYFQTKISKDQRVPFSLYKLVDGIAKQPIKCNKKCEKLL